MAEPLFPRNAGQRRSRRPSRWIIERLNGEDGLGAIYPAMANSVMMFDCWLRPDQKRFRHRLEFGAQAVGGQGGGGLLPALPLAGVGHGPRRACDGGSRGGWPRWPATCDWLIPRQILNVVGDWADNTPGTRPGGWAFQYNNAALPGCG